MLTIDSTLESVLQEALRLPGEDRAEIAARLLASLDADSHECRDDVEEAWAAEIERRCEALDAGTVGTRSWEEVRRRIETDVLLYRERTEELQVVAFAHTSRKPGYWRSG